MPGFQNFFIIIDLRTINFCNLYNILKQVLYIYKV